MRTLLLQLATGLLVISISSRSIQAEPTSAEHFDQQIAPLLAQKCLSCHNDTELKGELNLASKTSAMQGGESGEVIVPGDLSASLLWEYIDSDEMPPKEPLLAEEKKRLKQWIASGAAWGTEKIDPFRFTTEDRAGYNWWSLQPLSNNQAPSETANPIDAFIYKRLKLAGLSPSVEADKRTLIRRLSFDLLGLPPTPEQIDTFLSDYSEDAYEKLVDRTLQSPHYGERWARHWLDIVRFGESNGFEYDQPRDNAWHYRNWVIDALNQDMPYDEFVQLQLAGDVLHPKDPQAIAAAGFLVAGAHNTTLPSSQKMRMTMAQDELEDLVGVVGQTFLGLTVGCARCHDHKFDPISQKEYYQFAANLTGVKHGERSIPRLPSPDQQQRVLEIDASLASLRKEIEGIEQPLRSTILADRKNGKLNAPEPPASYASWEFNDDLNDTNGKLQAKLNGGAKLENGSIVVDGKSAYVETATIPIAIEEKTLEAWVQLDNLDQRGGGVISIQTTNGTTFDAIVFGEKEPKKWMAGSNGFVRTESFAGEEEKEATSRSVHIAIVYTKDGMITAYREGKPYGKPYKSKGLQKFEAGSAQIIFGLRHGSAGGNKMLSGKIQRAQFYNRALSAEEVAASAGVADSNYISPKQLLIQMPKPIRNQFTAMQAELKKMLAEKKALTNIPPLKMYTSVSSDPGVTKLLRRGSVADPGETVSPNGLSAVPGIAADFNLKPDAIDADRRKKLAEWITSRENPLFARVIVNRLWHYHFGQGLVSTPSDFGFNGGTLSHPELLDWLAKALKDNDYRLKSIHRLIVTSATYRQSSKPNSKAEELDADNLLLWRKSPKRLEAEAIRDATLMVSNQLNPEIGGKGYRDVRHFSFKGSNFYENLTETGTEKRRRTIYRFSPRGGRNPFLDTFDCPDPSTTTPQRANTTTPLQALTLMNNGLIFQMADSLSKRVTESSGDDIPKQVALVYQLAYGRNADKEETEIATDFVKEQGLPAFCRVIFNSNEFVFVQ
ncbi:MAG: hypothetical protein COA78_09930 [Blastopirellula sp.]|nr:MAG: hypothetical protein COA78_09930 [Blastopirellula sp.]